MEKGMSVGLEVADSGNAACLLADTFTLLSDVARIPSCCHACCMKTQVWNHFASFHALANAEDLVCLSRIRWRWADPRLRSLLAGAAQQWRVFFVEIMPPAWLDQFDLCNTQASGLCERHAQQCLDTTAGIARLQSQTQGGEQSIGRNLAQFLS